MKQKIYFFLLASVQLSFAQELPDNKPLVDTFAIAKITVLAQDESGDPVPAVSIHMEFTHANGAYNDGKIDYHGKTNSEGKYTAESQCTGSIFIKVSKNGYYTSMREYQPADWSKKHERGERLEPWNPTVPVILKKIGKGAPMYVRISERKPVFVPSQNLAYGYDLLEDDWVAPHGSGKVADLSIRARMNSTDADQHDGEMSIAFPNKGDGYVTLHELKGIESELKYPREAPLDGYAADPIILRNRIQNPDDVQGPDGGHPYGYILRIRTRYDKDGNVVSAIYAKVIGRNLRPPSNRKKLESSIEFGSHPGLMKQEGKESGCYFTIYYCLNPAPNDRTLEVDRKMYLGNQRDIPPSNFAP